MRQSVMIVHNLVMGLDPGDNLEAEHRAHTLGWLRRTDDVFRRVKPAEPDQHLVSYVVPVDPGTGSLLLVDHVNRVLHTERERRLAPLDALEVHAEPQAELIAALSVLQKER